MGSKPGMSKGTHTLFVRNEGKGPLCVCVYVCACVRERERETGVRNDRHVFIVVA